MRPLAFGYFRLRAADPPDVGERFTAEMQGYAEREGLTLAEVYNDPFEPPAGVSDRSAFCALVDALRRDDTTAVIIPAPEHLSRRSGGYTERRTIIETEAGARLLVIRG